MSQNTLWTEAEWAKWVGEQTRNLAKAYHALPDLLIADHNREINYTRDYHGRELLELLQNADDAGEGCEQPNHVALILTAEGLCVANSGKAFSDDGVVSLMISDNSPKRKQRSRYIGNKGLGFRSILNWTNCPFIMSGRLAIGFDQDRAQSWLEEECRQDKALRRKVDEEHESQGSHSLIPTLAVPAVLDVSGAADGIFPRSPGYHSVLRQALRLREANYDTVIALPFTQPDAYEQVEAQLEDIGREFLLFTKHLASLTVRRPSDGASNDEIGFDEDVWQVERAGDIFGIRARGEDTQTWQIFEAVGDVPEHLLREDMKKTPGYQIRIAVPQDDVTTPGFLFNYFPTQARFPYPLVAHVTFEVANNRQSIPINAANQYLVQRLAQLMADVAESSFDSRDPWRPLSFISTGMAVDHSLEQMGFSKALYAAAKDRDIIPVRSGSLVKSPAARRLKFRAGPWLPLPQFDDVVEWTENTVFDEMLRCLDVCVLDEGELRIRLNQASPRLLLSERTALITGLVKSRLMPSNPAPALLIDQEGQVIPPEARTFLPPSESEAFPLPAWMSLWMLHGGLSAELRSQLGTTVRGLSTTLNIYSLTEFSLTSLSQALVAQANERVRKEPERENYYRLDTLQAVYKLYRQSGASLETMRSSIATVYLPNAAGKFASANSLYFSREFACGKVCDMLYRPIDQRLIIASTSEMGLENEDGSNVEQYLRWLGVVNWPRIVKKAMPYYSSDSSLTAYRQFVAQKLNYPVKTNFAEFEFGSSVDMTFVDFSDVESVEHLEELVVRADPHALLAWVALDERVETWRRQGDRTVKISITPPRKQQPRVVTGQHIPSYILWILGNRDWLPASNGSTQRPSRCILSTSLADELKAILPRPFLAHTHHFFQELDIDHLSFQNALQRVGVRLSIEEVSQDEIYDLLLKLPVLDPEGHCAKSLHRALMSRPVDAARGDSPAKSDFVRDGKLWGVMGTNGGYFPVSRLYYIGTNVVPQVIVRKIPRLELDKKQGSTKVERVFGVQSLDSNRWKVAVDSFSLTNVSDQFAGDIERLKPYIYAVRLYSDTSPTGLQKLKSLQFCLCNRADGSATVDGASEGFSLEEHGEIVLDNDIVFLFTNIPLHEAPLQDVVLVDAISEVFAEFLGVERGSDFARLASAPPSQRLALLARVLGATVAEAGDLLQQAQEKLETPMEEVAANPFAPWVAPPVSNNSSFPINGADSPHSTSGTLPIFPTGPVDGEQRNGPIMSVTVEQEEHIPTPPSRTIQLRVQVTPATSAAPRPQTRVTNAARCQEVILHFEKARGRHPLPVSQLQGERAYGCDVLSFESAQLCQKFVQEQESPNIDLVARFIEVKGKSNESSTIELRGNELRAAELFRHKYYLYRVYEELAGEFSILTLADPISASCNHIYELNLGQQQTTERYRAIEEVEAVAEPYE